jgi:putative ATPase
MRPQSLQEYAGQEHVLGKGKLLRRAIEADRITSLVLFGPPGTGKTSLAACIAQSSRREFVSLNATTSNVQQVRAALAQAKAHYSSHGVKTILFIDELHRFNKAQQDVLLPDVEQGNPILIGATVHNPYFSIAAPLLSRSIVCELKALSPEEITGILQRALGDAEKGLGKTRVRVDPDAMGLLAQACQGDARRALSALEIAALTTPADTRGEVVITLEIAAESLQKKPVVYDRDEDAHYDTASAFIKSMRGSDPDAAIYWMAKMLYAGEDPRFVARRICICAAEDVGNADPLALVLAHAALGISEFVGMPEARIPLAQAAIYVACAPKSNASYLAIDKATEDIAQKRVQEVPDHLKDTSYKGAQDLGHGKGYKYAHDFSGHYVPQQYTGQPVKYYEPSGLGHEAKIKKRLEEIKKELKEEG